MLLGLDSPHLSPTVNAENNWWGTDSSAEIDEKIYDCEKGIQGTAYLIHKQLGMVSPELFPEIWFHYAYFI